MDPGARYAFRVPALNHHTPGHPSEVKTPGAGASAVEGLTFSPKTEPQSPVHLPPHRASLTPFLCLLPTECLHPSRFPFPHPSLRSFSTAVFPIPPWEALEAPGLGAGATVQLESKEMGMGAGGTGCW